MQIVIQTPGGATVPIAATIWRPLAEALETVALRGGRSGRGDRWSEAAVLSWFQAAHRPPVDDVVLDDGVLTLSMFGFDTVETSRCAEHVG